MFLTNFQIILHLAYSVATPIQKEKSESWKPSHIPPIYLGISETLTNWYLDKNNPLPCTNSEPTRHRPIKSLNHWTGHIGDNSVDPCKRTSTSNKPLALYWLAATSSEILNIPQKSQRKGCSKQHVLIWTKTYLPNLSQTVSIMIRKLADESHMCHYPV